MAGCGRLGLGKSAGAIPERSVDEKRDHGTDDRPDESGRGDIEVTVTDQVSEKTPNQRTNQTEDQGADPTHGVISRNEEPRQRTCDESYQKPD